MCFQKTQYSTHRSVLHPLQLGTTLLPSVYWHVWYFAHGLCADDACDTRSCELTRPQLTDAMLALSARLRETTCQWSCYSPCTTWDAVVGILQVVPVCFKRTSVWTLNVLTMSSGGYNVFELPVSTSCALIVARFGASGLDLMVILVSSRPCFWLWACIVIMARVIYRRHSSCYYISTYKLALIILVIWQVVLAVSQMWDTCSATRDTSAADEAQRTCFARQHRFDDMWFLIAWMICGGVSIWPALSLTDNSGMHWYNTLHSFSYTHFVILFDT